MVSTRWRSTTKSSSHCTFFETIVMRNGRRSTDLAAPDFFLPTVDVNKLRTLDELKANIQQEIAAMSYETLVETMENAAKRALLAFSLKAVISMISYLNNEVKKPTGTILNYFQNEHQKIIFFPMSEKKHLSDEFGRPCKIVKFYYHRTLSIILLFWMNNRAVWESVVNNFS